ncbi:MAG TPA: zinc ribbon domain-containing protein [Aggregatilineales bacterium]|nr:zinc ribbon domain-containing protein [Anaerolineales bacterium]HRE48465.1 zinc ribbon domain-containing protein [Aggregatilineales bacterium]
MPRYDYVCDTCAVEFEARHGFDDPPPPCPNGHTTVHRVIRSAPRVMHGMAAAASKNATKEELQAKWAEETPKLRKQIANKLGEDAAASVPTLNKSFD